MDNQTITTGLARISFEHLMKPYARSEKSAPKYSVTILVPQSDTATKNAIAAAIEAATQEGINKKWGGRRPAKVSIPVYDGNGVRPNGEPFGAECKDMLVFTASCAADRKPQIVDSMCNNIIDPSQIYSGQWGRVNVRFFPYEAEGKRGIGCGLNCYQKIKDDEALSGGVGSAASVFGCAEVDPITGQLIVKPADSTQAADTVQRNPITGEPMNAGAGVPW